MAERGMDPFVKALMRFFRSLRPSVYKNLTNSGVKVGQDHLGNEYFEIPADPARGKRMPGRYYKPIGSQIENWDQEIPPEWNAWLRKQRPDPPTPEEMGYRLDRLKKLEEKREPKSLDPTPSKEGSFPKFPEYEDVPGTKY